MTRPRHILITGSTGFLGRYLAGHPGLAELSVTTLSRSNADICCDLSDKPALEEALNQAKPDIILNLAAMTRITDCEDAPDRAMAVNAMAVQQLADWCNKNETYLVQISTDHVFSRGSWALHTEEAIPDPPNQYGRSKLAGEQAALTYSNSLVVRTHFLGLSQPDGNGNTGNGFTDSLFAALTGKRPLPFFMDSYATPLHISDFCDLLLALMKKRVTGLVHLGGQEPVSRFGLAATVAAKCGIDVKTLMAGSVEDIDLPLGKDLGLDSGYAAWLLDRPLPDLARLRDLLAKDFDSWCHAPQNPRDEKVS